jgi:hypothetical protein
MTAATEKRCPHCETTKSVEEFYRRSSGRVNSWCKDCERARCREYSKLPIAETGQKTECCRDGCNEPRVGKSPLCRDHRNEYMRDWYRRNPDKVHERGLKRTSGGTFTLIDYEIMLAEQGGCCAICETPVAEARNGKLDLDHDHDTGEIRGLLCHRCNTAIGLLRDDPALAERVAIYLTEGAGKVASQ